MTVSADLGFVILKLKNKYLSCRSCTSIHLDENSINKSDLHQDLIEHLKSALPWIACHQGFRFKLQLRLDETRFTNASLLGPELRLIVAALLRADIWAQLNLKASLAQLTNPYVEDGIVTSEITLQLKNVPLEAAGLSSRYHALPVATAISDVNPHPGYPVYFMECVSISMTVTGTHSNSTHGPRKANIQVKDILSFLDGALTLAISSKPSHLPRDLRLSSNDRLGTLSELAPVLWRPGFLQATSERACFIPTICQSLARIRYLQKSHVAHETAMNTTSSTTDHLHSNFSQDNCSNEEFLLDDSTLARHLWSILQTSLHAQKRTIPLKPYFDENTLNLAMLDAQEEMLSYSPVPTVEEQSWTDLPSLASSSSPLLPVKEEQMQEETARGNYNILQQIEDVESVSLEEMMSSTSTPSDMSSVLMASVKSESPSSDLLLADCPSNHQMQLCENEQTLYSTPECSVSGLSDLEAEDLQLCSSDVDSDSDIC